MEAIAQHSSSLLVVPVTDAGHQDLVIEPLPHPVVKAPGIPPVPFDRHIAVRLVPDELLGPLLDNLEIHQGV